MRARRSAGFRRVTDRTSVRAAALVAAVGVVSSLLLAGTAQADQTPEPVAARIFATNARGGCTLDVWGSTTVEANLYINGRRSFFLDEGDFAIEMGPEHRVASVNTVQVRYRDVEVLAEYTMTALCDPQSTPSVTRSVSVTPSVTVTPCADRCGTRTPLVDPTRRGAGGLASTGVAL